MVTVKTTIGVCVAAAVLVLTTSVVALLESYRTIPNSGTVETVNVSVYQDSLCTQPLSSITWGMVKPGSSSAKVIYVKNEGNTALTLSMVTNSWSPSGASAYITVTWNREGAVLSAGKSVQANVTLAVSQSVAGITNFGFNMVIKGTD